MAGDKETPSGRFCRCGREMFAKIKPNGDVHIYCPDPSCYWNNRLKNRIEVPR